MYVSVCKSDVDVCVAGVFVCEHVNVGFQVDQCVPV